MRPPGEWQSYDVIWTAPRFGAGGAVISPARATVLHNGVLVQNNFVLTGETVYIGMPFYRPYTDAPIKLQAHGDPQSGDQLPQHLGPAIWTRRLRRPAWPARPGP